MPRGEHFKKRDIGKKFTSENQPAKRGQTKLRTWKDLYEELSQDDSHVTFPANQCNILPDGRVKVKMATQKALMINAMQKANTDVRYLDWLTKTTGGYITPKNPNEDMIEEVIRQDGGVVIIQQRFIGLI